ncbi:MAG: hypothetical protein V2A57_01735 [Elusimicrobiota bacterium]
MKQPFLEKGKYYHIFNKGRQGENLFRENDNYAHFLSLYEKYIEPVAETYAWVLLGNHFHTLIKTTPEETSKPLHQYFSNLFNAYSKAFNKRYERYGPLFVSPFKRIEITSDQYFKNLVVYIHNNPVHHRFVENIMEYPWSSYLTIISEKPTRLKRETVLNWFHNSKNEFETYHNSSDKFNNIDKFIIED